MQDTQKGSGMSHSSSSSQVDSSPKLQRRQGSGLHRTVAAVGQTELSVMQQSCARFDRRPFCSAAEIRKSSPERTETAPIKRGSLKDRGFPRDVVRASLSNVDVRSTVPDGVGRCDGSSSHSVVSGHENDQLSRCGVLPSYYKLPFRKPLPGRRPQSASDIDHYRMVADFCCVNSSESMLTLEERFNKTLEMNARLADKLATTCQQMEVLTMKLREFEVCILLLYWRILSEILKSA